MSRLKECRTCAYWDPHFSYDDCKARQRHLGGVLNDWGVICWFPPGTLGIYDEQPLSQINENNQSS